MIALFIGVAYILYRKRKLENYGEVIAFSWLKPVFIAVVAILSSMFSYAYFSSFMNRTGTIWLLPFGIAGTIIAYMVSKKSLSLKGVIKPVLIYLAASLAFCAVIKYDLTGYETRVPDLENIESVAVDSDNYTPCVYINGERIEYKANGRIEPIFTKAEDIENVTKLHKHLTETKDADGGMDLPIEYTLKDGRKLRREYRVNTETSKEYLKPVFETKEMRANKFALINGIDKEYQSIAIFDRRINDGEQLMIYPDNADMMRIIEALKKDMENMEYEEFVLNESASTNIDIQYVDDIRYIDNVTADADIPTEYTMNGNSERYYVRTCCKNTIKVLKEMGYYDSLPEISDIKTVKVTTWKGDKYLSDKDEKTKSADVTDKAEISAMYKLYDNMIEYKKYTSYENAFNVNLTYTLNNGKTFEVSCSYDAEQIPELFAKYF